MAPRLWTAFALLGGVSAALVVAASCAVPGFELVDGVGGAGTGMGGSGATSAGGSGQGGGTGGAGLCGSVQPSLPPDESDPGPDDVDLVVAVRSLDFGEDHETDVGPAVGYDLDKECTCLGGNPTCQTVGAMPNDCDGPGGRDNAVARLFKEFTLFEPDSFDSQFQSAKANDGEFSILVRVRDYNGQPNDDAVTVIVYSSPGLDSDPCLPSQVAQWDGTDAFPVDALVLNEPGAGGMGTGGAGGGCGAAGPGAPGYDVDDPKFVSQQAFVSDGVLVANLPASALVFSSSSGAVTIDLVGGFLTGDLQMEANGWALRNGVLTGRWTLEALFAIVGRIESNDMPICKDNPLYGPIKSVLCNFPDITSSVTGAAAPCDALSFGMGFEAEAAQLGIVVEPDPDTGPTCPPEQDPAGDTCDP